MKLLNKINRAKGTVIFYFDEPRLRNYEIEMPFDLWWKMSSEVDKKIAKSHRA